MGNSIALCVVYMQSNLWRRRQYNVFEKQSVISFPAFYVIFFFSIAGGDCRAVTDAGSVETVAAGTVTTGGYG